MEKKKSKETQNLFSISKLFLDHFSTFSTLILYTSCASQVKLGLFLRLEMAVCNKEGQHPTSPQVIAFLLMDALFLKFLSHHSTIHFAGKARGNRKDGVEESFVPIGGIPSKIEGRYLKKRRKKVKKFWVSSFQASSGNWLMKPVCSRYKGPNLQFI